MLTLAIDQGTTGTTVALFNESGRIVRKAYREFTQIYPNAGWVEHDPLEIWSTVVYGVEKVVADAKEPIAAVGITNQRETTVVWNRGTGAPVCNAIVWQCRRTASICAELSEHERLFRSRTGLPLDAYFSGTKIKWILDNVCGGPSDDLAFGTIDSWLIWKLTEGRVHATDHTNASRTLLYNIMNKRWDPELCDVIGVPMGMLPEARRSCGHFGDVSAIDSIRGVPILGVAGDQQSALFGQCCHSKGQLKNTYGTGCFVMMNTGAEPVASKAGLVTTLAVAGDGSPCFALEGSVFIAGAAVQWLRDELGLVKTAAETEEAALAVTDNNGVYLVPAFVGLGAPHWDSEARGVLTGLTRGANRNHVIRAALESMAYQTLDVFKAMQSDAGAVAGTLAVDGGASANNFLMQFQADILERVVARPRLIESTALGAAFLAGLGAGVWKNSGELFALKNVEREFIPSMTNETRSRLIDGWRKALRQARTR